MSKPAPAIRLPGCASCGSHDPQGAQGIYGGVVTGLALRLQQQPMARQAPLAPTPGAGPGNY